MMVVKNKNGYKIINYLLNIQKSISNCLQKYVIMIRMIKMIMIIINKYFYIILFIKM